jgi:hypothetical protein
MLFLTILEYQAKEMVNQSLGTMTSTSSSLTSSLPESDRKSLSTSLGGF